MNRSFAIINLVNISKMLVLFLLSNVGRAELEDIVPAPKEPLADVYECGMRLLKEAGKEGGDVHKLPPLYVRASGNTDAQFLIHMLAVIYVESKFDKTAKSQAEAYGLMQMTAGAVTDSVTHCKLKPLDMGNLYDSYTNVRYGTCYLGKLLQETEGDWDRALIAYNGGYAQLQKYDKGETIAAETANYVLKVTRAVKLCSPSDK